MTEFDQTRQPQRTGDVPKPPPAPGSPRALSADLRALAEHFRDGPVRLAEVVEVLKGRGYRLLIVLLCLPILTPIPLSNFFPGISAALLAAGSFEEDGLVFLVGLLMFAASLAYFALLALGGAAAIGEIWQRAVGS